MCFETFVNTSVAARREGDANPSKAILGTIAKLFYEQRLRQNLTAS